VFAKATELESKFLSYQDIVVLDEAPNDISVVQGIITQEFQTPLSHLNVLSRNRHTPNMGLRNALSNEKLLALEGKLVRLEVGLQQWSIREATAEETKAYLDANMPTPMTLPAMNLDERRLVDIEDVAPDPPAGGSLREAIKTAVLAFGGKAAHYSILARLDGVPVRKAFAIPVYYYSSPTRTPMASR
jgi:phosphoenolpyruvate-protein kinase (PTS system EI component)